MKVAFYRMKGLICVEHTRKGFADSRSFHRDVNSGLTE